jgi:hypothetical protein
MPAEFRKGIDTTKDRRLATWRVRHGPIRAAAVAGAEAAQAKGDAKLRYVPAGAAPLLLLLKLPQQVAMRNSRTVAAGAVAPVAAAAEAAHAKWRCETRAKWLPVLLALLLLLTLPKQEALRNSRNEPAVAAEFVIRTGSRAPLPLNEAPLASCGCPLIERSSCNVVAAAAASAAVGVADPAQVKRSHAQRGCGCRCLCC